MLSSLEDVTSNSLYTYIIPLKGIGTTTRQASFRVLAQHARNSFLLRRKQESTTLYVERLASTKQRKQPAPAVAVSNLELIYDVKQKETKQSMFYLNRFFLFAVWIEICFIHLYSGVNITLSPYTARPIGLWKLLCS